MIDIVLVPAMLLFFILGFVAWVSLVGDSRIAKRIAAWVGLLFAISPLFLFEYWHNSPMAYGFAGAAFYILFIHVHGGHKKCKQ